MADVTQGGDVVQLGHAGAGDVRADGLQNVFTGMGTSRDKTTRTTIKPVTFMGHEDLEGLYAHWLMRRIVDLVADESTRQGFEILFGGEGVNAETLSGVEQAIESMEVLYNFNEAAKTSRLYGGSALLLYIDDGRPSDMPVDKSNIRAVEGMDCLDRHQIAPIISEDSLYDYSKATYYQIISGDLIQQPNLRAIHKDRILRFDGIWLPYRTRQKNYGWGMSVLQSVYDSFKHYYSGTSSIATLLTEFDIFVHKVRGLASLLAAGKEGQVRDRLQLNDMSKSIYRGYAIDAEKEELAFVSRQFGGVSEILEKLRIDVIAAAGIPHTLLFGQSPSGLGATGRSEERDFAKTCHHYQETHFRKPLMKLMEYIMLSKTGPTGGKLPDNWRIGFKPLFEMNERELADVRARVAAVDARYIQVGVLTPQEVADSRFGKSQYSIETTIDPSIKRELPEKAAAGQVPPGGRDPLDQQNGTLPMDGTREASEGAEAEKMDEAGLYMSRDLEQLRDDVEFKDKELHQKAIAAAKAKFKTWPSAVAGAYVTRKYKELYKQKHGGMSGAFKGKKETAEYFKKDAVEPLKTEGLILGGIDEASLVTQADIDAALNQWKQEAPERFKDILEAGNAEPTE